MIEAMTERIPELEAMRQGTSYFGTVQVRGFSVVVRPLSNSEWSQLVAHTASHLAGLPADARTSVEQELFMARETIKRATSSDVGLSDYKLTDEILNRMTVGEILAMFKSYNDFVQSVDPSIEHLTIDQVMELVEEVKKNMDLLTTQSRLELASMVRYLVTLGG